MKNYWLDNKEGVSMETCLHVAARIWCDKEFSHIVMNPDACKKIASLLFEVANHYNLEKSDLEYFRNKLFNPLDNEDCCHG